MPAPVKINIPPANNPRVLVAPLDWGLGHATRCIPIIKELLNQKCEVLVASAGAQMTLLRGEFPSLIFVDLQGYDIKYDKNRALTIWRLLRSIPKILIRIKREKAWLMHFASRERLDLVISDNRYGLTAPGVFCVLVTHQLTIKTPFGAWSDHLLQGLNYRIIRHFSRCWVPDTETAGLAGALSHPRRMPRTPTRYIGWLSRFGQAPPAAAPKTRKTPKTGYLLALLSGPEPQRTLFEKELLRQAADLTLQCPLILVRGLPKNDPPRPKTPPGVTSYDHLPAAELESLLLGATLVIARSGYSTIMDLQRLGKRALLIPTPGQSEQEYLAAYLARKGWASSVDQHAFSLSKALELAADNNAPVWAQVTQEKDLLSDEVRKVLELARSQS